ncbi:MAG: proton-conducting membrane transporter [Lachnospiraceae bacterium]|nr:proton-conducting membrane transporter [Lachnospiraceae bacterium]
MLFFILTALMWVMNLIFSIEYMNKEKHKLRYYCFYTLSLLSMTGICMAGNLITMYMFYELMAVVTLPLVLHEQSREAIEAGKKYIFYSMGGAFMGLAGFFFAYYYCNTLDFIPGGGLNVSKLAGNEKAMYVVVLLVIIGFGSKAGLFPLHGWLPSAHPVAPSPASAFLSGNITKMGVFAIVRYLYYIVGVDFLRGSFVHYIFIGLTMFTIIMGSMMAYKEQNMKKRLAYSTVSQVSYALFGFALFNRIGFTGGILHVIFHSFAKNALFEVAGAVIHNTGLKKCSDYKNLSRKMPVSMWCFTLASLTLVGIPPTSAFLSKWYLAQGALDLEIRVVSWLGPVFLIISALLTAGYLLSISLKAFFPGDEYDYPSVEKRKISIYMLLPMLLLSAGAVVMGIFAEPILRIAKLIAGSLL